MAGCRHVLAEHHRYGQEQCDPERRETARLHRHARGAGRLSGGVRVAIPPIAVAAFHRRRADAQVTRFGGETMGTTWSALVVAPPAGLAAAFEASLAESVAALSQWAPDSALSRFNRAPQGEWQELDPILATVLKAALDIGEASGGAFDPAAGALSELWGFGAGGRRSGLPQDAQIAAALTASGSDAIEMNGPHARRLRNVRLDLSGIGKGHAVDRLAGVCRQSNCPDVLVEIGGEFVGAGVRPDGQPWWIELESPPMIVLGPLRVAAHELAVATSGDYRRYIPVGQHRLGHTIDPRTGRPIDNCVRSVSVIAADCMAADGWATALSVLGPEAGMALAARKKLAARMVTADGVERLSPALTAMLDG